MKVVITDYLYENLNEEKAVLAAVPDLVLEDYQCKDEDKLCQIVEDADVVVVQFAPITRKVIESMKHCRLIVRYAIGVDNIDIPAATERGIWVANVPDYGIDEVSTHAIALLLAASRKLIPLANSVKEGEWNYTPVKPVFRLCGKTLGLVGFGRIPMMVAEKMAGFGLKIQCFDPYVSADKMREKGVEQVDLDMLLRTSDFISLHCPLTDSTKHMINREAFAKMKPTAVLINTARGPVVEEAALIEALQQGKIFAAGIDVVEKEPIDVNNPLLHMDNVIVTPHTAWYSEDAIRTLQRSVAEEAYRVLTGQAPKNAVNKINKG